MLPLSVLLHAPYLILPITFLPVLDTSSSGSHLPFWLVRFRCDGWKKVDVITEMEGTRTAGCRIKKQIPLEALSRQRKDKEVSTQQGWTEGKSCLTNLSAMGGEMMAVWMKRRAVGGIYLNFGKVTKISCCLLAAKLVSYGLQTENLRWVERWFIIHGAWDC